MNMMMMVMLKIQYNLDICNINYYHCCISQHDKSIICSPTDAFSYVFELTAEITFITSRKNENVRWPPILSRSPAEEQNAMVKIISFEVVFTSPSDLQRTLDYLR